MIAVIVDNDKNKTLLCKEIDDPIQPSDGYVLVDVAATAVNRADLLQRAGRYPPPLGAPETLGLEIAGRISQIGEAVTGWSVGDRVCAIVTGGGYAERCWVHAGSLMMVPEPLSLLEAAAVPEAFLTAFVNLFEEAQLNPGESVLIHGGASGVGTAAIQLAVASGCRVAVTARDERKLEACRSLGAELTIDHTRQNFAAVIEETWGGVDVILDIVGADYVARNLSSLRTQGRMVLIATLSGGVATVDLTKMMQNRLRLVGSVLRARSDSEKAKITAGFTSHFLPMFCKGQLKPVIDRTFPIRAVQEAHTVVEHFQNVGKVVMSVLG